MHLKAGSPSVIFLQSYSLRVIETQPDARALKELSLETLRLEIGSLVDADLREKVSDLLFSVDRVDSSGKGTRRAGIYFLFEHKSQTDPLNAGTHGSRHAVNLPKESRLSDYQI